MYFKKKKAFTLTELLVVVIVIGILAAVVLPKFNKVIETRKTTEAEELMAAVRTEQEKRCALDKNYLTDLDKLSEIIPASDTKNFTYVATATGIQAKSKGKYGYTLEMPSYRDGRLCCESAEECTKLNKDYPLCSELTAYADYQSGAECAGEVPPVTPTCTSTKPDSSRACSNGCGTQVRQVICNSVTNTWTTGPWTGSCTCECTGTKPEESQACNECGTQTRTVECDSSTGEWVAGAWSECDKTQEECSSTCYTWEEKAMETDPEANLDYVCEQLGGVSPNAGNISISTSASKEEVKSRCCVGCSEGEHLSNGICCPDGQEAEMVNGQLKCVVQQKFKPQEMTVTAVYAAAASSSKKVDVYANDELFSYSVSSSGSSCGASLTGTAITKTCPSDLTDFCSGCDSNSDSCNLSCYVATSSLTSFPGYKFPSEDGFNISPSSLEGCVPQGLVSPHPSFEIGSTNAGSIMNTGSRQCSTCGGAGSSQQAADYWHNWWASVGVTKEGSPELIADMQVCCVAATNKGTGYRCVLNPNYSGD